MELASSQSLVESSVNGSSFLSKVCTRKQQRRKLDDAPPVAQPSACKCDARTPADYLHRFGKSNGRKFKLVAILILFALVGKAVPALAVAAPESPKVQGHGERLKGGPFQFSCEASSGSHKYTWLKDGVMLSEHTERTLNISSLSEGDSGLYQCSYRCGNRACMSEPFNLVVQVFEHLTLEPKVMEVEDGQAVLMRCIVNSSTPATLTLYVSSEKTTVMGTKSHYFDVRIPPDQDYRIVQCQASLPGSRGTLNGYARLYRKGMTVKVGRPTLKPKGDPVRDRAFQLECRLPSLPFDGVGVNISFTLSHNGTPVGSQQLNGTFEFARLIKEDDGLYTCTATVGPPETVSTNSNVYPLRALEDETTTSPPTSTDKEEELVETTTTPPISTNKEEEVVVNVDELPFSTNKGVPTATADYSAAIGWGATCGGLIIIVVLLGLALCWSLDKKEKSHGHSDDGMEFTPILTGRTSGLP